MSDAISLDPRKLTLADLKRARAGPLEGRNPMDLFNDTLERSTLVMWCIRSRHDPEFTWADAEACELGDFQEYQRDEEEEEEEEEGEQPPDPPGASPGEPSARPDSDAPPSSKAKPPRRAPSASSASSSASPDQSTTP